ncbi:MAG: MFS transporter [Chlamydiae bacterium CG10_big_fil_rev_8_21_14_0_10_42_34]|nr:MAG: MFS transporter [Chlamydiae bacterium CG10_big_fil_rev_8_21_14_0_10_42_34]
MNFSGKEQKPIAFFNFFIWLLAIIFFFFEFFLRVLPATFSQSIITSLNISAQQFALIGSAYYLTYSLMQIPVGILIDQFGTRRLVTLAAATCSIGALWFGYTESFIPAFISRLMIGFGSSFGFVTLVVVTLNWLPKKYFAFFIGCGQFLGAIGPLLAGAPIAILLKDLHNNWRIIFLFIAIFGAILTLLFAIFMRDNPVPNDQPILHKDESFLTNIKILLSVPQIWWIITYAGFNYVALPLLGAFWGTAYLESRGFDKPSAAFMVSMIWVGLAAGSVLFGRFSDATRRRKPSIIICAALGIVGSLFILITTSMNTYYLSFLFFIVGVAGSGQNISFALIAERSPQYLHATAFGINNTAIMAFAALIPPVVTSFMHNISQNKKLTEASFEQGLIVIPVFFAISLLITLFGIRETYCKQQDEIHEIF